MVTRQAAAAGRFYPADRQTLYSEVNHLLQQATTNPCKNLAAIIVPHAGYVFSGQVAAEAFHMIHRQAELENIFLLGPGHYAHFHGASVFSGDFYHTPLGEIPVNTKLVSEITASHKLFTYRPEAHLQEHSLEVQLPFLQVQLKNPFRIVPILTGHNSTEDMAAMAKILEPFFNPKNLFVISTDLSHFPAYQDAITIDKDTVDAILKNDPASLLDTLQANKNKKIPGLATSLCGEGAVMLLLHLTQYKQVSIEKLMYRNSGDSKYGNKEEVVGYQSSAITRISAQEPAFSLSDKEKKQLLFIARNTLEYFMETGQKPKIPTEYITKNLTQTCGAFVSIYHKKELRGCIGRIKSTIPLHTLVKDLVLSAAFEDERFPSVKAHELPEVKIEISVLTPLQKIAGPEELELGRHGIFMRKGPFSGTFLPQVAEKNTWTKEEFLGRCARDKAHIGWDGWSDAELYVYETISFKE
jgi:hypothetical protein